MNKQMLMVAAYGLLAACNDSAKPAELTGVAHDSYFAVVSTNYMGATSISLLGEDGDVVASSWAGSMTKNPDLRSPLADDLVLPTTSESRHYLTTLERGLGVVTRFDLTSGEVLGQVRTDDSPEDDQAAFHSNPQDVFYVSERSAWVSRWSPNPDASAPARERGTDLIEFDPSTMKRGSRRIDLSKLSTQVEEMQYDKDGNPTGTVTSVADARPAALVSAGKYLVVGLVRCTSAYTYAPGMIAVVDPDAGKYVGSLALDGLSNCGEVRPVLDAESDVLVACIGSWGDDGDDAGIVRLHVDDAGKAKLVHRYRVADHADAANTNGNVVSLGGNRVVAIAPGELDPATMKPSTTDAAYSVDIATGKQRLIWKSAGAFSLGIPAFDAATGALLIPDAGDVGKPLAGVHRFLVDPDTLDIADDEFVKVAASTTLAAREVHAL